MLHGQIWNYHLHSRKIKATSLILSESVSSLSLYLQEMGADRMHDDVKAGALAKWCEIMAWPVEAVKTKIFSEGKNLETP